MAMGACAMVYAKRNKLLPSGSAGRGCRVHVGLAMSAERTYVLAVALLQAVHTTLNSEVMPSSMDA